MVFVEGEEWSEKRKEIPYDTFIQIVYHKKKQFAFPYSIRSVKGMNLSITLNELKKIGFTNVKVIEMRDLIKGWLVKENSVEKITIDGSEKFIKEEKFEYDAEITIYYHTYKKIIFNLVLHYV